MNTDIGGKKPIRKTGKATSLCPTSLNSPRLPILSLWEPRHFRQHLKAASVKRQETRERERDLHCCTTQGDRNSPEIIIIVEDFFFFFCRVEARVAIVSRCTWRQPRSVSPLISVGSGLFTFAFTELHRSSSPLSVCECSSPALFELVRKWLYIIIIVCYFESALLLLPVVQSLAISDSLVSHKSVDWLRNGQQKYMCYNGDKGQFKECLLDKRVEPCRRF